jgi:hypothetical protein
MQCVGHTEADKVLASLGYVRFGTIDEWSGAEDDGLIVRREHLGRRFRNCADALGMLHLVIDGSDCNINVSGDGHVHRWRYVHENSVRALGWGEVSGSAGLRSVTRGENQWQ